MTPETATLREALAKQYVAHGLPSDGGESDPWFRVHIGPLTIPLPNPSARQRAVFFHDTNHVLTGYDTVFSNGEMVIAGFEVGSGCGTYWIAWFINLNMFAVGLFLCPRAMFRAFVRGRRSLSMYCRREDRTTLSTMTLAELRALIGLVPRCVSTHAADHFLFVAWAIVAVIATIAPVAATLVVIRVGVSSLRS